LIILGDGEERQSLQKLIDSLKIRESIDMPGFVLNPYAFMKKASVFVLSSRWEGLPNALIQAMACGAPVVSTDCRSGPAEILDGGKYGRLVPVGDVEALADAIETTLKGDRRRPPASWLEQFSAGRVVRDYLKVLDLE
jgi:glycosyltransferase involved in cell wall biosynthesis